MAKPEVLSAVQKRIEALGFSTVSSDVSEINFYADLVFDEITANINQQTIPSKLQNVYIDMICGYFLEKKYNSGDLDGLFSPGPDITDLTDIKVGNVSVGIDAGTSPRQALERFIQYLKNQPDKRYLFDIFRVFLK